MNTLPIVDRARRKGRLSAEAEAWRANPFYRLRLGDGGPDRIAAYGPDPRRGDRTRGQEIASGVWRFGAEKLALPSILPWRSEAPSRHFAARLHGFSWLLDLASLENALADQRSAALLEAWIENFGEWDELAWDAELVAERLYAWLCYARPAIDRGSPEARPALMRAMGRHARLLTLAQADLASRPHARAKAGAALLLAGLAGFPESERLCEMGEEIILEEGAKLVLPDGAHISRNPEAGAELLCDLVCIARAIEASRRDPPPQLAETAAKLANMTRMLRASDGGLACFHGGSEGAAETLDSVLAAAPGPVRALRYGTHAGYQRIQSNDLTVIFDAGAAPPSAYAERAHAGALSFEASCGRDRLIVNVGAARDLEPEGRLAARTTAAHSTVIVADALSAHVDHAGRNASRFQGPHIDDTRRSEDDDGVTVQARHHGYKTQFGLLHRRYLFVDHKGQNIRGIDELIRPTGLKQPMPRAPIAFLIRFHLHPSVKAEMLEGRMVALHPPSGIAWRFRSDAETVEIAPSIYFGARGAPQETKQIVLGGNADPLGHGLAPPNRVRWALARIT